ncbi:MAG: NAD-dependent epimerase/dehydratase family protein [Gemmatimonadetes bacterium]|nr:NAD-dependent epimerase/dehydratase family protein [Gemmatimonadota bacterium]
MMGRVLVTGGAGFIGSHVADAYLEAGYEVTILDNLSSGRRENVPHGAKFVRGDIGSPEARRLLATGGFTHLNHHAAQIDVRVSVANPQLDATVNILGLLNLLEGAREGGVRRVIFASSGGVVYGESDQLPHREDARKLPVSGYGASKLASEYYLAVYAQLYRLETVALRYANVYGPRQNTEGEAGVVAIFGSRLRRREPLTVFGDGRQTRDYVFVGDVAQANLKAATGALPPLATVDSFAFNVGTGREVSVNELVSTMLEATGTHVPVKHAPARVGELLRSAVDPGRIGREWGWRPEVVLVEGLRRTYEWIATQVAA